MKMSLKYAIFETLALVLFFFSTDWYIFSYCRNWTWPCFKSMKRPINDNDTYSVTRYIEADNVSNQFKSFSARNGTFYMAHRIPLQSYCGMASCDEIALTTPKSQLVWRRGVKIKLWSEMYRHCRKALLPVALKCVRSGWSRCSRRCLHIVIDDDKL